MGRGFMNPLTQMNVRQQLILLFVLMVSPIAALNLYGNDKAEGILQQHVTEAYLELSKQHLNVIDRDIDTVNRTSLTIIQNPLTQGLIPSGDDSVAERAEEYENFDKLLASYSIGVNGGEAIYYSFFVHDPDDYYFIAPNPSLSSRETSGIYFFDDAGKPAWYDDALLLKGRGKLQVIDHVVRGKDVRTLAYTRAVNNISRSGGDVIGVLVVTNMEKKLRESLRTVELPQGEIYLTDLQDRILASTKGVLGGKLELPHAVGGDGPSGIIDTQEDGYVYIANVNRLAQHKLVYKVPTSALLSKQSDLKQVIQLLSLAYFALGFVVIVYFWRSLMTPLHRLAYFVRAYEPGSRVPETPGRGRKDEVGVLLSSVYQMARRLNVLIHDKYLMELKQKEAQLQILYQQINPHLLYNTLESIYWKSMLEGKSDSAEMIKELSKLMKIGLSKGREVIALSEELEHAAAYVRLEQKRYAYEFEVSWQIAEEAQPYPIPKITLQPLIENAIIHGVRSMGEDGRIAITAALSRGADGGSDRDVDDRRLVIQVQDNGYKGADLEAIERLLNEERAEPSLGYGIRNIHQRIQLRYGSDYGLRYAAREGGGTVVTITLPTAMLHDQQAAMRDEEE
jgi:two-component system, sensor histidine kinase YesM